MRRRKAFTLIELLVVISIIALLISILLPALSAARKSAQEMTNNTRMRGIIQDMVAFAQDNNHYFPGVNGDTHQPYAAAVTAGGYINGAASPNPFNGKAYRPAIMPGNFTEPNDVVWAIMLNHNLFAPKYLVSPGETSAKIQPVKGGTSSKPQSVYLHNGSYAIDCFANSNDRGRRMEWSDRASSQAVAISDRSNHMFVAFRGAQKTYLKTASIWTSHDDPNVFFTHSPGLLKHWTGGIAWSDDHVVFSNTAMAAVTRYDHVTNPDGDNIFNVAQPLNETAAPPQSNNFGAQAFNAFMQYAGG